MVRWVLGFCLITIFSWIVGLYLVPPAMTIKPLVHEWLFLTGTLSYGLMAMTIVIAARPIWVERLTRTSLDRLYLWHRYIGALAIIFGVLHLFGKDLSSFVLALFDVAKTPKATTSGEVLSNWAQFWGSLKGPAEITGEVVIYAMLCLIILTFVRWIPYRYWLSTHRLFSVGFLLLAFHTVRLLDKADWLTPFGWVTLGVTAIGSYYSMLVLVRGAGRDCQRKAVVRSVSVQNRVSRVTVEIEGSLGALPGQFVFLVARGEKHPFSIASITGNKVEFCIKHLGDYTEAIVPKLKEGEQIAIEGPWGEFCLDVHTDKQGWVAAGIGIVPFCAWLEAMAQRRLEQGNVPEVHLSWCISSREDEPMYAHVVALAERAGVRLDVYESKQRRLNPEKFFSQAKLPEKLAICAGTGLADRLEMAYTQAGGAKHRVMREFFVWR